MGIALGNDGDAAFARARSLADEAGEPSSGAMRRVRRLVTDAARHEIPVLLVGETGTGKTTWARALHALSRRAERPFVRVDCPAGMTDLAEYARRARTGTLFLDEVAELSPDGQSSALAIVDAACRVGAHADIRVVASAREGLDERIRAGLFRSDLYYRLSVFEVRLPPLRERAEDIIALARAFVDDASRSAGHPPPVLSPELESALRAYRWPGNVAELQSVVERILILDPVGPLDSAALPERMRE